LDANVLFMTVMVTALPFIGRGRGRYNVLQPGTTTRGCRSPPLAVFVSPRASQRTPTRSRCVSPTGHEIVAPNACNSLKESNAMHSFAMHAFGVGLVRGGQARQGNTT